MTKQTYIAGKDLSLEETIAQASRLLKAINLPTESVSWLNPAPHCWSVHIRATSCQELYTNGKGISREASMASGLGEFFERLSTNFFFADFYLGPWQEGRPFYFYPDEKWFPATGNRLPEQDGKGTPLLSGNLRKLYNPHGELSFEHLCDNNSDAGERGICALPFKSLTDGQIIYFPVSLLNNLYVSNGMSAGNSVAESCSQALSEIIERYVKNIIISKGISLPDVPLDELKKFPKIWAILNTLNDTKLKVRVKDASLGGQFPVIAVLLSDATSGGAFAAFGANCRFETAIERTLTELLQGRELHGFQNCPPPCHDLQLVDDPFNLESHFIDSEGLLSWNMFKDSADFAFSPWDFHGTTTKEFGFLQNLVKSHGFHCYLAEYQHLGMYSCRIIVPGMSEIYPIDDLLWNNKASGASLRPHLLNLQQMTDEELLAFFEQIEVLGLNDQQSLSYTIGVLFDPQSAWSTLRIGELKAMLLLAVQNYAEALLWCEWSLNFGELPTKRKHLYSMLHTLLSFQLEGKNRDDYSRGLQTFYSEDELERGGDIIRGKIKFPGLVFAPTWSEISDRHGNLLTVYQRINSVKADFFQQDSNPGER